MAKFTSSLIRKKWLDFFQSKDHLVLPSKSLIPENDPSLLWVNSGVATLKPYFSGLVKPLKNRLTNSQKCIRTNDILNVGLTSRHHTFFEMLGNFSIGDYFKIEAINFAYELLVYEYRLDPKRLYITVYEDDLDAYNKWIKLGINPTHIIKCNRDRNFWDVGSGPCGPCTEIYYDRGEKYDPKKLGEKLFFEDIENDRYVEIWNIVFSQFNNNGQNEYTELAQKNIDTGCGLERMCCVLQDVPTNYDTDLFVDIIKAIEKHVKNFHYDTNAYFNNNAKQKHINQNFIVIADHLKASVFAIADGAIPSGKERGAVLRKLIRRAIVCAWSLHADNNYLNDVVTAIINSMKDFYPYLNEQKPLIISVLNNEMELFNKTFNHGIKLFDELKNKTNKFTGEQVFKLTDTYGFPFEVIKSLCHENDIAIDEKSYLEALSEHQKLSSNNQKDFKAMLQQNPNLINLSVDSNFDYHALSYQNAKIVALFDENFNPTNKSNNLTWIVFDHTTFYATSGGQNHDEGTITLHNKSFNVIDVIKAPNNQHLHLVDLGGLSVEINDLANLNVDENVRKQIMANHSSEHLLQKALQTVISHDIHQEGASKTKEHLTFDFSYAKKLTLQDLIKVENKVNEYINSKANVEVKMMTLDEAKAIHAQAHFEHVYSKIKGKLRVVCMEGVTSEVCGGTHVNNLSEIEEFMIIDFVTKGSGSYRIEAISKKATIDQFLKQKIISFKQTLKQCIDDLTKLKVDLTEFSQLTQKIKFDLTRTNYHYLVNQMQTIKTKYMELVKQADLANKSQKALTLKNAFDLKTNALILVGVYHNEEQKLIVNAINMLAKENPTKAFIGLNQTSDKLQYIIVVGNQVNTNNVNARSLINEINQITSGFGGGSNTYAQGGCNYPNQLDTLIELIKSKN